MERSTYSRVVGCFGIVLVGLFAGCEGGLLSGGSDFAIPGDGGGDAAVPTCRVGSSCDGGLCVAGGCCALGSVCGGSCCGAGSVCLFDACVVPGKACRTANDCAAGEYCETALGDSPDGGPAPMDDGGACTQPPPPPGRCLSAPPVCPPDGGAAPDDGGCLAPCEYHAPVGPLKAVPKWTWGPTAQTKANFTDVWSTPAVGRIYDGNCDGRVDQLDAPNVVFVSGKAIDVNTGVGTCCQCTGAANSACLTGVLRMLDGRTGQEVWSLDKASMNSIGFAGLSVAIGDVDGDGRLDIAAVTGEGFVVLVDAGGKVLRTSDKPIPGHGNATFGWGGGLAIADIDGDGFPEIAYGATVFTTTNNAITLKFTGTGGIGGGNVAEALSAFVDLDGAPDNHLELLAGRTAYRADGTILWDRTNLTDGFVGVGDFDGDGKPEVVLVSQGKVWLLDGAGGQTLLGPVTLPGNGFGGPPTVADFDGDKRPEIGVAQQNLYSMLKPDFTGMKIDIVWQKANHDLSSSVTGSSVFDFEGDGRAEVVYGDECYLWVYDGQTGAVRFAAPHTSFTATEASVVADVDGDGRAEIVMVSNGADPSSNGWNCLNGNNQPTTVNGVTWTPSTAPGKAYRGIVAFGDPASSWVGTRTLWSEHTYHVTNICDDRDSACDPPNVYGSIPKVEKRNWLLPWANNFRQNVQDRGIFDAPDATVHLDVDCTTPFTARVSVRNIGLASLPAGVAAGVYKKSGPSETLVGQGQTTRALLPGQTESIDVLLDPMLQDVTDHFIARILVDPQNPTFHQCREDNDESAEVRPVCLM